MTAAVAAGPKRQEKAARYFRNRARDNEILYLPKEMAESKISFDQGMRDKMAEKAKELENILSTSDLGLKYGDLDIKQLNWEELNINVAVTGKSGAGKSTFINAILGLEDLEDEEEDLAETGVVETTKELKPFHAKNKENVVFWDLPGVGTPKFEKNSYVEITQLGKYDYFIILSSDRFTEEDVWLADYVEKMNRKFYFVRTHVQEDLENDEEAHPNLHDRETVLTDIRGMCTKSLAQAGLSHKDIFLVDSFETNKYDFPKLSEKLVTDAGEFKACVMAACIASETPALIERKMEILRTRINRVAAICGNFYNSNVRAAEAEKLFLNECLLYRKTFGLDEVTVRQHQRLFQLPRTEITEKLRELRDLNKKMSFLCGFSITTVHFAKDHEVFHLVALLLLDYLNLLHDKALEHAAMIN